MNVVEIVAAVIFACLGVRSLVHWARSPFEGSRPSDFVLYAFFVTGRVGMWLVLATAFALYAVTDTRGRAFTDDALEYSWLYLVFLALGGVQLVAAYLLGQRARGS